MNAHAKELAPFGITIDIAPTTPRSTHKDSFPQANTRKRNADDRGQQLRTYSRHILSNRQL
ncbi:hypothetical protein [Burkholderia cenocepacia]|uniref:hypothetical protein n=1 Tax=Burkholderia cenocepacia TaxID=95486 RepID=UPI001B907FD2|nr:hypothetical protein [Burkholderia cenocepacia]MBR8426180.1 hypothetical protein [Burkholderia cenocepacia]